MNFDSFPTGNTPTTSVGNSGREGEGNGDQWLPCVNLTGMRHIHKDGSECTELFLHQCLALGRQDPGFVRAYNELVNHFRQDLQEKNSQLQSRIADLKAEIAERPKAAHTSKSAGVKRKHEEPDKMDVDSAPPTKCSTPSTSANNSSSKNPTVIPQIGFGVIDRTARPNPYVDLTLIEHTNLSPGFDLRYSNLNWNLDNGTLNTMPYIRIRHQRNEMPSVISVMGQASGAQRLPTTSEELSQLVSTSQIAGNFAALIHLSLVRSLAMLLEYLHSKAPTNIVALTNVQKECLSAPLAPDWAGHTLFMDPAKFMAANNSFDKWEQTKTEIPSLASHPDQQAMDEEWVHGIFVFHNHYSHYGVILSDSGFIYLPSILSY
ncbi:hypothetical protein L218DRAFT_1004351 [Marasmius fiardii PR-910]|nr:hypothetical protein L218DRAFT_1004351 [Marasmius fiardii PR-910]